MAADDGGVGDGQYGGRVDEDGVEQAAEFGEQVLKTLVHEQFGWVGRDAARGDDREIGDAGGFDDVRQRAVTGHVFRYAELALKAKFLVDVATAQVGVDNHDMFAGLGEYGGEILRNEAFPKPRAGAGNQQGGARSVEQGEMQGGAQAAQAFDGVVFWLADGEQFAASLAGFELAAQG